MAIKLSDLSAFDKKHVVLIGVKSATSIISFKLNQGSTKREQGFNSCQCLYIRLIANG